MSDASPTVDGSHPVALLATYRPDSDLGASLIGLLQQTGLETVVVVDDGSGAEFATNLAELGRIRGVVVLRHHVHLGRGAALKTGLNWIGLHRPQASGVITLDPDERHAAIEVTRVAEALRANPRSLVLGSRALPAHAPLRLRIGNLASRMVMRAIGGVRLSDIQTGLRGIPMRMLPDLLRLRTVGRDFEIDMLLAGKRSGVPMLEVALATPLDPSAAAGFNPAFDSFRIYYVFLRFNLSSISAFLVDYSLFALVHLLGASLAFSQFGARAVSSAFNFAVNRRFVFRSSGGPMGSLLAYYATVLLVALCSFGLILVLHRGLGLSVYTAKILADSGLYFASFAIQREFVFRRSADEEMTG